MTNLMFCLNTSSGLMLLIGHQLWVILLKYLLTSNLRGFLRA